MAVAHISITHSAAAPHARPLRKGLDLFEEALTILKDEVAAMPGMVDGSDYTYLETQFGLPSGKGQSAKGELESVLGKLTTDASVTNVAAAIQQLLNTFA